MEQTLTRRLTPRLVIGLTLVWIGAFWLIDELGYHLHPFAHLWPLGLILLAATIALHGGGWVSSLVVGGFGLWLLGENLDLFDLDLGDLWPLVLVFFGARLIMRGIGVTPEGGGVASDRIRSMAILGNRDHLVESTAFRRADVTSILGNSNLDFGNARLSDDATIDLLCLAGGVTIRVPSDTRVVSQVVPFMAGYEDKRRLHEPGTQTLQIRGIVMWGGVEILNASPETGEE